MVGWYLSHTMRVVPYHILIVVALVAVTWSQNTEDTSIQYRMTEENEPQKVLGNVAVDAGLDVKYGADVLDQLRFSFLAQSSIYSEHFSIGEQSGLLQATTSIDRDELCPHQVTCDIPLDISVQPGQYFQIIKVTVSIEDLNDNTPTFPENPVERFLSEASGPGASLPIQAAEDPDSPRHNIKQYRQVSGLDAFELRVRNNSDGTVDMQLVLKHELDREANPLYQVEIVASDGDKSGTVTVEIEIKDVNDNNPKFDNQTYETFVYENTPKYTTILKVHARDPDAGANGEIVYGFTTRTRRAYGDIFNIDEITGEIFVVEILDYEDGDVYILDVTAQDKSADPLPTIAKVTINVRDLNDHAPQITVNSEALDGHVEISEDAQIGDFVAHITVIDPDAGQNGAFTCSLDDNSHFELLQLYKTEFKIVSKALFDREQQAVYDVALVCTDQGGTPQASTKHVEIQIADVNDHPPVFIPDFYNAITPENNKIGAPIIQVKATDRDTGLNGQIRYGFSGIANELFDINPVTGNITAKVILDHEEQQSLTITVTAKDQGNPQLSASATLLLNVQDIDDEAPKFSKGTYVFGVEENLPAGTSVGQISATDPDSEPYNFFTFGLDQRYNAENAFRISESDGIIYTTMMLDREIQGVYHLVVIATSTGSGQQNNTNVFVSVLDQNDNAPVIEFPSPFNNTVYVKQNDPAGNIIGYVIARDNDTEKNKQLTFNITNGNADNFFAVNKHTGAILVNGNLNGQEYRQFSLVLKVHDNGVPVKSAEAILNIVVNQSSAAGEEGNITSNQNLTIVIAIATVSGFLMVILIIAIVVIIRKQRRNDQRKKNKYNYMPKIVEQKPANGAVSNGQLPSSIANGDARPSGTPKKEVSFKTKLDHPDSLNGSFDVSIEKADPMEYTKAEVCINQRSCANLYILTRKIPLVLLLQMLILVYDKYYIPNVKILNKILHAGTSVLSYGFYFT